MFNAFGFVLVLAKMDCRVWGKKLTHSTDSSKLVPRYIQLY